jgi:hypothetical protein
MTVSCSTNLAVGTPCTCQMPGRWRSAYIVSTACASLFDDVWWIGWMDGGGRGERERESEVGWTGSTCGFKSANCKIGCRNGQGRPTARLAVIGCFYYWWLLAGVREAGEKAMGQSIRLGRPDLDLNVWEIMFRIASSLSLSLNRLCLLLSSPLLFSSLFLPPRFLFRGILTPSFFPLLCANCYFF